MGASCEIHMGDTFGRWVVVSEEYITANCRQRKYLCQCSCEKKTIKYVYAQSLRNGMSKSCGCYGTEYRRADKTTHGYSRSRLHAVWAEMKNRCNNPNDNGYAHYGGRGIKVCPEWEQDYMAFHIWAYENGYDENAPKGQCTIDRIDVNKDYCPSNCRWTDSKTQAVNKRNNVLIEHKGEVHCLSEWASITGLKFATLWARYKKGFRGEDLFSKKNLQNGHKLE